MYSLLTDLDSWFTASLLAVAMLLAWGIGFWRGRNLTEELRQAPPSRFGDASLAVLGLLLAFTFSMSQGKYDQRRQMVVNDSNAIGDFYTCASLIKEPTRSLLQKLVQDYVQLRLALARERLDPVEFNKKLDEIQQMQNQMQSLVGEAVDAGTPIALALVNTYNSLTSNHAARLAAVRDRMPGSIVVVLFASALITMALVGVQQGAVGERHPVALACFVTLVCLVVWVTLDFNSPNRGMITVSQEPLHRLLTGMNP